MRMQRYLGKYFLKFAENRGLARAWFPSLEWACQNRGVARAQTPLLERSVKMQKYWWLKFYAWCPLDAHSSVRHSPSLKRRSRRSSVRLRAPKTRELEIYARAQLWTNDGRSSVESFARARKPNSEISRFASQAQTKHSTPQISTLWAHYLGNTCKLIV